MSKINAFRVVNLNYNNNAIRVENEIYHFDGESTLLSLRNGGGKSVLVQMMLAPFVHKRYRDLGSRSFSGYFTTNKPTFLLVEWKLDGGAGYVLTGMMVRARQQTGDLNTEDVEELEIINFIHEYAEPDGYDIERFPIIEYDGKVKKLKGFHACKQMFDELKKDSGFHFFNYDMNQGNQQRSYFTKLKEYAINSEEWETILFRINQKESGLSELFKDAKNEAGLIEKWFLRAVENKLNKEENRMKQFQSILKKYIFQYKENQSRMERKNTILQFQGDAGELMEKAELYQETDNRRKMYENRIACLRNKLLELVEQFTEQKQTKENDIRVLDTAIREIQYEEKSYEYFEHESKLVDYRAELEKNLIQKDSLQRELDSINYKLHIQECSGLYEKYARCQNEYMLLVNKLDVEKRSQEELRPERENLGYTLNIFYNKKILDTTGKLDTLTNELENEKSSLNALKQKKDFLQKEIQDINRDLGRIQAKIEAFDQAEESFNQRYSSLLQYSLQRNILGGYEDGTLETLRMQKQKQFDEINVSVREQKNKKQVCEEDIRSSDRKLQDLSKSIGAITEKCKQAKKQCETFDAELEQRKVSMRYLDIPEELLYEKNEILGLFQKKIDELNETLQTFRNEKERKENQLRKLKAGTILELPDKFRELLQEMGINYIFGMEWLKKNGRSENENQKLVKMNPMIPFSIILGEKDLTRLAQKEVDFFTSYPIPIIRREELSELACKREKSVLMLDRIQFFVAFNHHLLNETALKQLLQDTENEIAKVNKNISQKCEEIDFYLGLKNDIQHQNATKELYEKAKSDLAAIKQELHDTEILMAELRERCEQQKSLISQLELNIKQALDTSAELKNMLGSLVSLSEKYAEYKKHGSCAQSLQKKLENMESHEKELDNSIIQSNYKIDECNNCIRNERETLKDLKVLIDEYRGYKVGKLIQKDIGDIKARYQAITSKISSSIRDLEEQAKSAQKRVDEALGQLKKRTVKYELKEDEFKNAAYDEYKESLLEKEKETTEQKVTDENKKIISLEKTIAVEQSRLEQYLKDIKEKFDKEEPKARESILGLDFKARTKMAAIKKTEEEKLLKNLNQVLNGYESNYSSMAEFEAFLYQNDYDFTDELLPYGKKQIEELELEELQKFRGELIRDYRQGNNQLLSQELDIGKLLDKNLRKPQYQDDFFRKPLEVMLELVKKPQDIVRQIGTILSSYKTMLEKLLVDLSFVEKERQKVLELLMDYIGDVHGNLNKIDKNSTIKIRERFIKMVRLNIPEWEQNLENYKIRLNDYVDNLCKRGLERLAKNENIEELIGTSITTRNLYDSVVGIGCITIKLYKIEAEREYPISWAQVSQNSGGEGFLSAFAILSCLLSYMRRDDTDLFIEKEEGKVLIMDNPFAQTNASHLLIPLMNIAQKCNTQLICLSGLSGESIYNRFDNIYVLNLLNSNYQKDVSYLTSEHVKSDYQMSSSRIQVEPTEQLELLF